MCHDVEKELLLPPITAEIFENKTTTDEEARLDIKANQMIFGRQNLLKFFWMSKSSSPLHAKNMREEIRGSPQRSSTTQKKHEAKITEVRWSI